MTDEQKPAPPSELPRSRYELVMIASREARRINELARLSGKEVKRRITDVAWERLQGGRIKYTYSDEPLPAMKIPAIFKQEPAFFDVGDETLGLDDGA